MFASTSTAAPSRPSRSPRRRSPLARAARTALALAVAGTAISAVNGAMYEPPEGQVMLGFWFDPANRKSPAALRPPLSSSRARPSTTHRRHQKAERATGRLNRVSLSFSRDQARQRLHTTYHVHLWRVIMALHGRSPRRRAQAPDERGVHWTSRSPVPERTRVEARGGSRYRRDKSQQRQQSVCAED